MKLLYSVSLGLLLSMAGCSLDYENTSAINPDNVWNSEEMITAFLTDIAGGMMPGWPMDANDSDEGMNGTKSMSTYHRGLISVESHGQGLNYENIDKINYFLTEIETVPTSVLTENRKKELVAEACFWRAWDYWGKVKNLGGVPLILKPQNVNDQASLLVSRNSTSECMKQILADMDVAIADLPDTWDADNYGRVDKGCAMAFKGRVLLWYASPLFNPNNDKARWEDAYKANKEAVDFLASMGKGLYEGAFEDIWYDEQNCETVMVNQYFYPDHAFKQTNIRPEPFCNGGANKNQAILPLMLAFPSIDGSKLTLDIDRLVSDPEYNAAFMDNFYTNRDLRFYATVFMSGTPYPSADEEIRETSYWNGWKVIEEAGVSTYSTLVMDQLGKGVGDNTSGWFQLKGLDRSLDKGSISYAETDWIEIRFTEVLMNYGECANEVGKSSEALQVLYDIRKRAGIEAGNGNYGIMATSQSDIRQAYVDERFIEFAYEGKRWGDLRRWKRFDILNNLEYRSGLYLVIKNNEDIQQMDWSRNMIDDRDLRKMFRFDYIECLDGAPEYKYNLDLNHWFYPIKQDDLDRNSKLQQNKEWGGTFDPLL